MRRIVCHTEFDHLICPATLPIREVIARIDRATPQLFQIVVDDARHVLGTVTDGDIRRAMLRNVGLEDPVSACMHRMPVTGLVGDETRNMAKLRTLGFLPILGADGRLASVLSQSEEVANIRAALVLAGGFGTRLGESTQNMPKPMLRVGERPILDRVLTQLEDAGVETIYIALHYLADQVEAFVMQRQNRSEMRFIQESEPRGTAGALSRLPKPLDHPVVVVNGDIVSRVDFNQFYDFHLEHDYAGTVAASRYEVRVPFGVLRYGEDGLFSGVEEKPTYSHFVAAGIYALSPAIVSLVPERRIDMPELLDVAHKAGLAIGLFPLHEYWVDVGRPADLALVRQDHDEGR